MRISASAALQRILRWCHQWNGAHPWDHNAHYHRWVLRQLPTSFDRALDVGCGTGDLARTLRSRSLYVLGVDIDERSVTAARHATPVTSDIEFRVVDAMDLPQSGQFDVITALAVVHHMPLAPVLRRLRGALAPGGTLVVLGCYREATRTDWLLSILAIPANVLIGGLKSLRSPAKHSPMSMTAPTALATGTLAEIRRVAAREVPESTIRRHLFWRYSLIFRAPRA